MVTVTTSTAVSLAKKSSIVVNASSLEYPKKAKKTLGFVPNAATLGLKPFNPPRFVAMHPDTPDEQVAAMSERAVRAEAVLEQRQASEMSPN